jgi:hypothetical protein
LRSLAPTWRLIFRFEPEHCRHFWLVSCRGLHAIEDLKSLRLALTAVLTTLLYGRFLDNKRLSVRARAFFGAVIWVIPNVTAIVWAAVIWNHYPERVALDYSLWVQSGPNTEQRLTYQGARSLGCSLFPIPDHVRIRILVSGCQWM